MFRRLFGNVTLQQILHVSLLCAMVVELVLPLLRRHLHNRVPQPQHISTLTSTPTARCHGDDPA